MLDSIEFLPGESCVGVTTLGGSSEDGANSELAASERPAQRELLELARAGDERALRLIYEQHENQVRGHLFRLLGRDSELDDLVQIVFSRAFAAIGRFEGKAAISTWLYRITVNTSHNLIRQRFRRERMQRAVQWFEFGRGADRVAPSKVEARDEAQRILAHLAPDLRQIFVLYHHEGLTLQEISEIIERPLSTVGDRLTRARKQLRELVSQD
ncbi:RNA polymerase sigma factor [Enhygromyxa salina]|uniref:ECF RNA polymerase sigma-E factor n=1 Tax=Enhygromyxa salina TaxID=215803 RepID=A0A2S9YBY4_9BACT|nr:RNA polymerase sigma factor [Enhygromyxa salina]PRQ02613.1 ECF RNA polymerase sigma-E factor [Enhygromyxa salina]